MNLETCKERVLLGLILQEEIGPHSKRHMQLIADDVAEIGAISGRMQRRAVYQCNRGEMPKRMAAADRRDRERLTEILGSYGVTASTGGDPRGCVVKLHLKSKRYNTMGGVESGWGVVP